MGNIKIDKNMQFAYLIAAILLVIGMAFVAFKPVTVNAEPVDADAIAQAIIGAIELPSANASLTSDKLDYLYAEATKDDAVEKIAEELALDELESKDFSKDLISFLMEEVSELQDMDYKDVNELVVRDIEVTVEGEDAIVEIEFKAYVSNFGDEDEEEKARVSVSFLIEDLDEDDDYEEAEVADFEDLELIKFYD